MVNYAVGSASGYLQQTGQALSDPLASIWQSFVSVTPTIIAGVLVLIFGYILSSLIGALVHAVLNAKKIDDHLRKARLAHSIGFLSVANLGGANDVLVSRTVKDLVAGSGIKFEDFGTHPLKGVPDTWHLARPLAGESRSLRT